MISHTELMIMDWVMVDGKPTQVIALGSDNTITTIGNRKVSRRKVSPVRITPKILIDNGFEKIHHKDSEGGWLSYKLEFKFEERFDGNRKCIFPKYIELAKMWNEKEVWALQVEYGMENALTSVKYVHNLQHIMDVTGVYKSIIIRP